jgi:hypothetical protein
MLFANGLSSMNLLTTKGVGAGRTAPEGRNAKVSGGGTPSAALPGYAGADKEQQ